MFGCITDKVKLEYLYMVIRMVIRTSKVLNLQQKAPL